MLFLYWSQFFLVDFQDKLMMHGLRCSLQDDDGCYYWIV
jgi:hypothetical protein